VAVFDNLEKGRREAVSCPIIEGDLRNLEEIKAALKKDDFEAVLHFAAYIESGESMKAPLRFFKNNTCGGINLLTAMKEAGISKFVFSSTAGVYGGTKTMPLTEESAISPTSYYSQSKYFLEEIIRASFVYGIRSVIFRYSNAAGGAADGSMGEDHHPETHLIPLVIQAALGRREEISIFGDDYKTKDGTCIRDYVHVEDLARAHILALDKLARNDFSCEIYNVGVGKGYSVKEVIKKVKEVSGVDFPVKVAKRRPGDWAESYADSSKIQKELGWQPDYGLKEIVESAYIWHESHPKGYKTT